MKAKSSQPLFQPSSLKFDRLIGVLLRVGVMASVFLITLGTFWRCLNTGAPEPGYHVTASNLFQFLISNCAQWTEGTFRPRLLVNSGLILLLLTPYLRVLTSVIYFAVVEKNSKYFFFTAFVLAALTYSLFLR